ncbi:MAG TPA: phosphoenolpyruvate carboxylase [Candidatus Limnocylindria bacterium]|nr:phosphoenolpyruvate carboxylase [Candidatus Limnocylindria bacterium]
MEANDARIPLPDRATARLEMPDALRRDVRLLADLLGSVLVEAGGRELLESVEELRRAAILARGDPRLVERCDALVEKWTPDWAELVARAFTCYFHLANLAEEQHRQRTLRERARDGSLPESLTATAAELRAAGGEDSLRARVEHLSIHPVLTAHPTEARRPEVIAALRRLGRTLDRLDDPQSSEAERRDARRTLLEDIETLWRTSQIREAHVSVRDEVRASLTVLDQTLFELVPAIYRTLDTALAPDSAGCRPPVAPAFIRFGTWAGGDRDGNPHVTAGATIEAFALQLQRGIAAIERSASALVDSLTAERADAPYRERLLDVIERLHATRSGGPRAYASADEVLAELRATQRSLAAMGAPRFAYGSLQHLIWQIETFGFTLAELEIRQHARVHAVALAELRRGERSPLTGEVLDTLRAIRMLQDRHGVEACHRYLVSFASDAHDVAAVYALADYLAPEPPPVLDVVPLFETLEDIRRAPRVLDEIVELPPVRRRLAETRGRYEVMLGYSDSAKESGPVAATFALYDAQAALVAWAARRDIRLTIFHGRGGALGRGGGPANRAILAQAPGSMSGGFKVTEQGEVVFARYGNAAIARRHLEQVASAVLIASEPRVEERAARAAARFGSLAERLGVTARRAYRELIDADGFSRWFALISPLEEIDRLRIGSRPARRGGRRAFEDVRAIPWVFAWAQTRLNLPGWYGLGSAIAEADIGDLRDAYAQWPLFATLIDNAEMSLAKTDREIAIRHLALGGRPDLTALILAEYDRTLDGVLAVLQRDRLLTTRPVLSWAVTVRNPYVDALSHLQLRALRSLRGEIDGDARELNERLLLLTMNGIAAGLQNTG